MRKCLHLLPELLKLAITISCSRAMGPQDRQLDDSSMTGLARAAKHPLQRGTLSTKEHPTQHSLLLG